MLIKYQIDENGFLTGNWATVGGFEKFIELEEPLAQIDKNLRWDGEKLVKDVNPEEKERQLTELRNKREKECFSVINRGQLWYATLSDGQKEELAAWYQDWLDVTEKFVDEQSMEEIIPARPEWLK